MSRALRFDRYALMFLLVVLPVALWPGSTAYEAAKFLVLTLVGGAWLLTGAWRVGRGLPQPRPASGQILIWLGLLLVLPLGGWFSGNMSLVLRTETLVCAWVFVVWLAYSRFQDISHLRLLLAALTTGAVLPALYGLAQIHGLAAGPINEGVPPGISTFGNENQMAGLAALAVWPALALTLLSNRRPARILSALGVVVLLTAVAQADATGPRLAVVGALVAIAPASLLLWLGRRSWVPWFIWLAVLAGTAALVLVFGRILEPAAAAHWPLPDQVSQSLAANSGDIRRIDWLIAWQIFKQNSLGCGLGNYQVLWPEMRAFLTNLPGGDSLAGYFPMATRAHNEYLQALAELGIPGSFYLTAMAGGLLFGIKRRWRAIRDRQSAQVWLLLFGTVLTIAVHALVSFPLHLLAPALVVAVVLGLLAGPVLAGEPGGSLTWRPPRPLALVPLVLGGLVLVLGVREFRGDQHAARGERAYIERRLPDALSELQAANRLMIWPGLSRLYEGLALMALERDADAHASLTASLRVRPSYEAMLALAELETARQAYDVALARLDRIDDCRPSGNFRAESRYLRGMVFLRQGNFPEARRQLNQLLTTEPRNHRGLLASGYLSVIEGKPHDARQYYLRALRTVDEDLLQNEDPGEEMRLEQMREVARRAVASVP